MGDGANNSPAARLHLPSRFGENLSGADLSAPRGYLNWNIPMTTPTTPAMTAQEALATIRQGRSPETPYGRPHAAGDADVWAATVALETRLADAERRATEAGALVVRAEHRISGLNEDIARMADRLSAVEARCGLMREFARWAIAEGAWEGGSLDGGQIQDKAVELGLLNATKYDPAIHGDNASDAEPGDEWFVYSSILAYPGGKSEHSEKEWQPRKDGHSKLVYDKATRTIVAVDPHPPAGGEGKPEPDWRDDPSADDRWNAGCEFAMQQLCAWLHVDPQTVSWDAATETLDGDVEAVIGNILRARMGDDWSPLSRSGDSALVEAVALLTDVFSAFHNIDGSWPLWLARRDKFIQQHGERK